MKRLLLLLATGMLFVSISCGGGGGAPTLPSGDRNLAGLEGTWVYTYSGSGSLSGSGETIPVAGSGVYICTITTNTVVLNGELVSWSYDGKTLTLQQNETLFSWTYDCGNIILTVQIQLRVSLTPGSTYGNTTGTGVVDANSDYCGTMSGSVNYSGNFSK
ncbi:hypothetical protein J7L05_10075 [bacterium]|nr:hypothetical protein [bacterium]